MNNNKRKKIWINVVLYFVYVSLALMFLSFLNYNIYFETSGAIFCVLIFIRTLALNALKPLNPYFHGNGLKYRYQKKDDLVGYEKLIKSIEKAVIVLSIISLMRGLIKLLFKI